MSTGWRISSACPAAIRDWRILWRYYDINSLDKQIQQIQESNATPLTKQQFQKLSSEVSDLGWRSGKMNQEFHTISATENENLLYKVNATSANLGLPELSQTDLESTRTLPAAPAKVPGSSFVSTRSYRWELRTCLKRQQDAVYVQENLTRQNRALLRSAKEWRKTTNLGYIWPRYNMKPVRKAGENPLCLLRAMMPFVRCRVFWRGTFFFFVPVWHVSSFFYDGVKVYCSGLF